MGGPGRRPLTYDCCTPSPASNGSTPASTRTTGSSSSAGRGCCADDELAVLLHLDGALLDRKIAALLAQESQTAGLVAAVGLPRFRAWVATEALAEPVGKRVGP